jgi:hypothetical protein
MTSVTDNLNHLVTGLDRHESGSTGHFAHDLASALLWDQRGSKIETLRRQGLPCEVLQVSVGGQSAAIFFEQNGLAADALIEQAALFAYHTSIEWGVLSSPDSVLVFNSHWIKDNHWFRLPAFGIREYREKASILEAMTPRGLMEGAIDRVATSIYGDPDEQLLPVDDALVDRLDKWRSEAIRHSKPILNLDEKLQTLFAQLFVLRATEDRALTPELLALSATLRPDRTADLVALQGLFDAAKVRIQSDLFDVRVPEEIPDFIHGGIIHDLYYPHQLPGKTARYNFSWVNADVLGRAYEKYLSTVLMPGRGLDPQLRLFDFPAREVESISRRKAAGVYYTPAYIVKYLTEKCLDEYYSTRDVADPLTPLPRIIDVSCGSGSFLTAALDSLIGRLKGVPSDIPWPKALVDNRSIVGIDVDERALTLARLSLWLRLAEEPTPLPLPSLSGSIVCGDSLQESTWANLPDSFEIVLVSRVRNPPNNLARSCFSS